MGYVLFDEFQRVNNERIEVNNAMIALLAGSRLASHTLKLTEGSSRLLPEIFPSVAQIERFNLVPDHAKLLLDSADSHVAAVSVPYALSVHEDFMLTILDMLTARGTPTPVPGKRKLGPATMHETFFTAIRRLPPTETLEMFHILREMRNSQIHEGGRANARLLGLVSGASPATVAIWQGIVGAPMSAIVASGYVRFSIGILYVVFAVTKSMAREVNAALQAHWGPDIWADLLVRDFQAATNATSNSSKWRRAVVGFARLHYAPVGLTETQIEQAARRSGAWTALTWR